MSIVRLQYLCRKRKIQSLVVLLLLSGCKTWPLGCYLKWRIGTSAMSLQKHGALFLRLRVKLLSVCDNESWHVSCKILEQQLLQYSHLALYLKVDPTHYVVSVRDYLVCRAPRETARVWRRS